MLGAAHSIIENRLRSLRGEQPSESMREEPLWIKDPAGELLARVQYLSPYPDFIRGNPFLDPHEDPGYFLDEHELPEAAELVVQTQRIIEFVSDCRGATQKSSKTMNMDARIIGSLCEALVGPLTRQPVKDAEVIAKALAAKGIQVPCSEKTLSNRLKQFNEEN